MELRGVHGQAIEINQPEVDNIRDVRQHLNIENVLWRFAVKELFTLNKDLVEAIRTDSIREFRRILNNLDNSVCISALESYNPMSVFEIACNTKYCSDYIRDCISIGCDVNKVCYRQFSFQV